MLILAGYIPSGWRHAWVMGHPTGAEAMGPGIGVCLAGALALCLLVIGLWEARRVGSVDPTKRQPSAIGGYRTRRPRRRHLSKRIIAWPRSRWGQIWRRLWCPHRPRPALVIRWPLLRPTSLRDPTSHQG